MRALWLVNQLWVIVPVNPRKNRASSELLYKSNRPQVFYWLYNNYSMSPSWIWSDKITNERLARVGYNHFISNKGKRNNCFSKFSNRVLPPIFISTILQSVRKENLVQYFPYDVKLGLLAHSRSCLANQKARNAIVGAENLLNVYILLYAMRAVHNMYMVLWITVPLTC